jgi:ADP-ribosylarginine hydrolase
MDKKNKNIIKNKCISIFLLHALGDTIGFKNSIWEFNYFDQNIMYQIKYTLEIISEFISLGGISNINLEGWLVSDDTILNYEIGKFILNLKKDEKPNKQNINILKKNFINKIKDNDSHLRGYGVTTVKAINKFTDEKDERSTYYNKKSGGNGCAMRTFPIGLRYYNDIDMLIDYSIITSKITHNSPMGFLGGLASAYFIKLAVDNVSIKKWPYLLIDLYESDKIKKYIDMDNYDMVFDYRLCIKIWKKYIELFFSKKKSPLKLKSSINLISRFKTYIELENYSNEIYSSYVGGNGQTAVIMAYNSLLDCDGNWEKLVYYGMLHGGDSDTVGAISGALYGAVYGSANVPDNLLKYLEFKDDLIKIGNEYFNSFF